MHACPECGKTYQSQNSLTRHSHNHRRTKQHACRICGVAFGRKDLLSRHVQIHQRGSDDGTHSDSPRRLHMASSSHKRKRCHTACVRCAELRRKCNGQRPCDLCSQAGLVCEYSRRTGRLSQVQPDNHPAGNNGAALIAWPGQQPYHPAESGPEDVLGQVDLKQSAQQEQSDDGQMLSPKITENFISQAAGGFEFGSDSDPNLLWSWPWIHESLYLPMGESSVPTISDLPIWKNMNRSHTANLSTETQLLPSQHSSDDNEAARQDPYVSPYDFTHSSQGPSWGGPDLTSSLTSVSEPTLGA